MDESVQRPLSVSVGVGVGLVYIAVVPMMIWQTIQLGLKNNLPSIVIVTMFLFIVYRLTQRDNVARLQTLWVTLGVNGAKNQAISSLDE